jgi:hypothetical protein
MEQEILRILESIIINCNIYTNRIENGDKINYIVDFQQELRLVEMKIDCLSTHFD